MDFEKYEGTAIDTSTLQEVQSPAEPQTEKVTATVEPIVEGNVTKTNDDPNPEVDAQPVVESDAPTEFDIPGIGKLTIDEIKEMRQGSLRQADYTKKTQELARQRQELKDAQEFFNYVRNNPHLIEAIKQAEANPNPVVNRATPEAEKIDQIAYNLKAMEVDMKLTELKNKYGEFDETALFQKANELGTSDLEFVLKGIRYESQTPVNIDEIVARAKEEAKAELKAELEQNRNSVATIVDTNQQPPVQTTRTLTPDEKRVAEAMGMTDEEYLKWL